MDDSAIDARLSALLAAPEPASDDAFVARVTRAVEADRLFRMARVHAWRRFRVETLATAGIAGGMILLWRSGPVAVASDALTLSPAAAMPIVLLLWLLLGMRPAGVR